MTAPRWLHLLRWVLVVFLLAGMAIPATTAARKKKQKKHRFITHGYDPAVSPDGLHLAFVRAKGGNTDLWIIGLDGNGLRRLTTHKAIDRRPCWSPDGQTIAFVSSRAGRSELFSMAVDGTGEVKQLTREGGGVDDPAWSPDGQWIAYSARVDRGDTIVVVSPEGTGRTALDANAQQRADETDPSWSPDGDQLVVVTDRSFSQDLLFYESTGENVDLLELDWRTLEYPLSSEVEPAWNPRADWVAFSSNASPRSLTGSSRDAVPRQRPQRADPDQPYRIFLVAPALGSKRLVTPEFMNARSPSWTPDGTALVYVRTTPEKLGGPGKPEIWIKEKVVSLSRKKKRK